jgi:membrane protease YdiL (CAAX protease family)
MSSYSAIAVPGSKSSSKSAVLIEVVGFIGLALISKFLINQLTWSFSGPISLLMTLAILTLYLRSRGLSWADMGLRRLPGIKAKLMVIPQAFLTCLAFVAVVAPVLILANLLGWEFLTETPSGVEDRWGSVRGNWPMYLLWLVIVWTSAAFGEEMFFRGYLITRLQTVFSDMKFGNALAVIAPALLFGCAHVYYQGLRGLVMTGLIGLAFGTMFLLFKRNLWPLILWHGIIDTLTFTAMFMNWE